MPRPNPLILLFLYNRYKDKFLSNPANVNKKPKGCFVWFISFYIKLFLVFCICVACCLIVGTIIEMVNGANL